MIDSAVADAFVDALVADMSPLAETHQARAAQHARARRIVKRAVATLAGTGDDDRPSRAARDFEASIASYAGAGLSPGDAFAAQPILIGAALPVISDYLDLPIEAVIPVLIAEAYADIAEALEIVNRLAPPLVTHVEIIDRNRMHADGLTNREIEVFDCVHRNATNREISELLGIQPYTVKNHVRALGRKLASGRAAMVAHARSVGYLILIPVTAATPTILDIVSGGWTDIA